ncbi:MAG: ring-hydroxylating dioxygenase, large terminal subunit [Verrucomicrobia bacterium]|jgi:phenylpropionate dioxygenase-like ring-hydroxylating dioxygenase large terminal subunit|nr:ring-hydroxylating dioxygenase, large terminal subunit [Verrucomicrobiota bacterium]
MTDGTLPYEISPTMLAPVTPRPSVTGGAVDDPLPRDIRKTGINPDFWYPVARSQSVQTGKAHAVTFAGEPIVLVRTKKGEVYAMEDRCAHRQVPLHLGVVEDDCIKCAYHGWKYDHTGKCVGVPYLEKCSLRPKNVPSYPCREAYGLIFVYPGDMAKFPAAVFPEIPSANDPKYKTRYLDRDVKCHYTFMHENLMDMNHQFLHRRLMGGIKTTLIATRTGPDWIEADYTFSRASGKQPLGEKFIIQKDDKASAGKPDIMTVRTGYPYQTLQFRTGGSEHPALDLWNAYVPQDKEQRTNHTFGLMMIRRPSMGVMLDLAWPFIIWFTNGIFAEDREICELEQVAFDQQGEDCNHEIFPVIRSLRKVLTENGVPLQE